MDNGWVVRVGRVWAYHVLIVCEREAQMVDVAERFAPRGGVIVACMARCVGDALRFARFDAVAVLDGVADSDVTAIREAHAALRAPRPPLVRVPARPEQAASVLARVLPSLARTGRACVES
jgi:hypothetical protein